LPEAFKNWFSRALIAGMGDHFARVWPAFDRKGFVSAAPSGLEKLELKERSTQITAAMVTFLPDDFEESAAIILASLAPVAGVNIGNTKFNPDGLDGWAVMPMSDFVGIYGRKHFDLAMGLQKEMTKRSSSEFGIRYLILEDPERAIATMAKWTGDPDHHVRRLVSEGSRPRLPWGMRLPVFVTDPSPLLPLLEALKDDESEYVRRSVANNLNDIAKDHPDVVADVARKWLRKADKNRQKLVKHACRTLIKQGHKKTLSALGFGPPKIELEQFNIKTPTVKFGEPLLFELSLASTSKKAQPLIIDYAIHHQKANGSTTPKVFKWKTITLDKQASHAAARKHPLRKITTRAYYPGTHRVEILINGVSFGGGEFELVM